MGVKIPVTVVRVRGEYIKLDSFLKYVGAAETGADAKAMILAGRVRVGDAVATERGRKLRDGAVVFAGGAIWKIAAGG